MLKRKTNKILSFLVILALILSLFPDLALAAGGLSVAPDVNNITITNNAGIADTVRVTDLGAGDKVKVYSSTTSAQIGTNTVTTGTEVTVSISQLGKGAGSVFVTVTSVGSLESDRTEKTYSAEASSDALDLSNITVTNNAGIADTVKVINLAEGDRVKVYAAATNGTPLGTATAATGKTDATAKIAQLGATAGSVYVTVTGVGKLESLRTPVTYLDEAVSDAPADTAITITNNTTGQSDTVKVTSLSPGDVVKVYKSASVTAALGTVTVGSAATEATITITQLGKSAGSVFITVTSVGKQESLRTEKAYIAEAVTDAPAANQVTVTNNAGIADTVKVSGLVEGDRVKVYAAATNGTPIGTSTVATGKTEATVSISQIGAIAGSVYVTVASLGQLESSRTSVTYLDEAVSDAPADTAITVTNNTTGQPDTVTITGLSTGDVIKAYKSASVKTALGTATVGSSATEATITITQLGKDAGSVFVTVANAGKKESARTEKAYLAEVVTDAPAVDQVTVTNNAGIADTVKVSGLVGGDLVKVYATATGGAPLAASTAATGKTEATVSISQIGAIAGNVYVTVTSVGKLESLRTQVAYLDEAISDAPTDAAITVTNNTTGQPDTVTITGLSAGDVIKAYKNATVKTTLGTATVGSFATEATITIIQLGKDTGSVFVTVANAGKKESTRTEKLYLAEAVTDVPATDQVTVTNNAGIADTVKVSGLVGGDLVKVYATATGGAPLAASTVATGKTEATVNIAQIGATAGSVYVTVTSVGKLESLRTQVAYLDEAISDAPTDAAITITNNTTGQPDTVTITGLSAGDVIKAYKDATVKTTLGTATVGSFATEATITITQLGKDAGSVFVTVANVSKKESPRTEKAYSAEAVTDDLAVDQVTVTNNAGIADTIKVMSLVGRDIVRVYANATGGAPLGISTVATGKTEATVSIAQIGATAGSVYVTVTSVGKLESLRTQVAYLDEAVSDALADAAITVTNNTTGQPDTIKVTGLSAGDVIKAYKDDTVTAALGTATVGSFATEATITITQLGKAAGSVFVTVANVGKKESLRTEKMYSAETLADAPTVDQVTVTNNVGIADTVKVIGLVGGDLVKVYATATSVTALGTAVVVTGKTDTTVSIAQLGTTAGSVYVTVTSVGKLESARTQVDYLDEAASDAPVDTVITITNNTGTADTVKVANLAVGDIVKVYATATSVTALGTAIVATGKTEATVSIAQLGATAGTAYVTVTGIGKAESARTAKNYDAEAITDAPDPDKILIINNTGADLIIVYGLIAGDLVKIYTIEGTIIGSATVTDGQSQVVISVAQLGEIAGTVYISATSKGKTESSKTVKVFAGE